MPADPMGSTGPEPPLLLLEKRLGPAGERPASGISIRSFRGDEDEALWLEIQNEAFADHRRGGPWKGNKFHREIRGRAGWEPICLLFARRAPSTLPAGCVYVEFSPEPDLAHVRWLAVRPADRRDGVGRALLGAAEDACRRFGKTRLQAETLAAWTVAVQFYEANRFERRRRPDQ